MVGGSGRGASGGRGAFAALLVGHRQRALLTQEQLALSAGLSVRTVSDLERGLHAPRLATVRRLAAALDLVPVETDRLLAAAGSSPATGDNEDEPPVARMTQPSRRSQCRTLLEQGDEATTSLRRHEARPVYVRAARLALRYGWRDELLHAAAGYAFMTKAGRADPDDEAFWRRAQEDAADDDLEARATLAAARAVAAFLDGALERARAGAQRALTLARRLDDAPTTLVAGAVTCVVGWGTPTAPERLALAEALVGLAPRRVPGTGLEGEELTGVPLLELGRIDRFRAVVERFRQHATHTGEPAVCAQLAQWRATLALLDGEPERAEALAAEAAGTAGRPPNFSMGEAAQLYSARRQQGRDGELVGVLEAMAAQHPHEPAWRCCLAVTLARVGEQERAGEIADRVEHELWPLPAGWTLPVCAAFLAEAAAILGRPSLGVRCEQVLAPYAEQLVVPATGTSVEGSVQRFLGLAALARGDRTLAAGRLAQAETLEAATGAPALAGAVRAWSARV